MNQAASAFLLFTRLGSPTRRRLSRISALVGLALLLPAQIPAQEFGAPAPPAHIAIVDGQATLERDRHIDQATANQPFLPDDRLTTTAGRLTVLFDDGIMLHLDEASSVELLSPTRVNLTSGRLLAVVTPPLSSTPIGPDAFIDITTPEASIHFEKPGEYLISWTIGREGPTTELTALRGAALIATPRGSTTVVTGERAMARDNRPTLLARVFTSGRRDRFEQWAAGHDQAPGDTASQQYLPADLQSYSSIFERFGSWTYTPPYGYVWYPTVTSDWRPYFYGYWSPTRTYGWTWVGLDSWAWPTHHYGRWGIARNEWFWIPDRVWSPAWVSWGSAPGYVSWSPLGSDGRPVFPLSSKGVEPWAGWVIMPRGSFGAHRHYVNRDAVAAHLLPRTTPFIMQSVPPFPQARTVTPFAFTPSDRKNRRAGNPSSFSASASAGVTTIDRRRAPEVAAPRYPTRGLDAPHASGAPDGRNDTPERTTNRPSAPARAPSRGTARPMPMTALPSAAPARTSQSAARTVGPPASPSAPATAPAPAVHEAGTGGPRPAFREGRGRP